MADVCIYVAVRAEELRDSHAALFAACAELGVKPVWSLLGEKVIDDETYSPYHSAEVSFALGDASWKGDGRPLRDRPLPVFAYADGDETLTDDPPNYLCAGALESTGRRARG